MRQNANYIVCDECNGAIPPGAGRIHIDSAQLALEGGPVIQWDNLDFCCTEHMGAFVAAQQPVPTPSPAYPTPPPSSDAVETLTPTAPAPGA